MASQTDAQGSTGEHGIGIGTGNRRDFLTLLTGAAAIVGAGGFVWPFLDSLSPVGGSDGAQANVDVDLSKVAPGQQIVVVWRGKPIFVVNRTPEAVKGLSEPKLLSRLADASSRTNQQPKYAENAHRSVNPEYAVLVGICTHLGCVPGYFPNVSATDPAPDWPGGYLCPCHGSKYDLAGRVYAGVPAPYNLPVPPYAMVNATTVRIGENPPGETFDLNSVLQV